MPSSPTPSAVPSAAVPSAARRARVAVSAVFLVNAVLYANVVPRLPEVKADLGLTNAALGAAIAAMPLGALLAGLLAPALIQRFGSAGVASFGLVALAGAVAAIPLAGAWVVLAGLFLLAGALDAVIDVAQNAHGFRVQRLYGRSIVNAFHGLWSVGAVLGGLIGSAAAGLAVPLPVHVGTTSAVFSVVAVVAYRFLLRGPEDAERPDDGGAHAHGSRSLRHVAGRTVLLLTALGAIAAAAAFVEDAGSSWGALYLAIAVGMGFALAVPSLASTLVGFALAGLGVATLVPAVMHTADELPGLPAGVGLTVVSWLLRVGFLVSPAAVGLVADATSLRVGLLGVVGAGVLVAVVGRVLLAGPAAGDDDEPITASGGPAASPST